MIRKLKTEPFDLKWLERGWWTTAEAFCIFTGRSPKISKDEYEYKILQDSAQHIYDLICSAEMDGSIKGMKVIPYTGHRAPCKSWLEWAMTKPSISINPAVFEAAGIDVPRPKESYRGKREGETKVAFLAAAKIALQICPFARLKDIVDLMKSSKIIYELPSDKTQRHWLGEDKIILNDTKLNRNRIAEVKKLLNLTLPASEALDIPSPLEGS